VVIVDAHHALDGLDEPAPAAAVLGGTAVRVCRLDEGAGA
jgi:hypothetical protein